MLTERKAVAESQRLFSLWLGKPAPRFRQLKKGGDLIVDYGRTRLVIEIKGAGDAATVGRAVDQACEYAKALGANALPVVGVPYMGDVGKDLCAKRGISWFDLSGNADISAPGLRVLVDGKQNLFIRRGRPSTAFAPKSARIARQLLIEPARAYRQQDLAEITGLDDGFTSRIVQRLLADGLVTRDGEKAIRVVSPDRLLDAWGEVYDFQKHSLIKGHIVARTGEELLERASSVLAKEKVHHAATGLAGAWLHTQFTEFRLATFFLAEPPSDKLLANMKFRHEPKGANTWFAVPNDGGVFDGATVVKGVQCAHPVQVFLDLQSHPERASEASLELRARLLQWRS